MKEAILANIEALRMAPKQGRLTPLADGWNAAIDNVKALVCTIFEQPRAHDLEGGQLDVTIQDGNVVLRSWEVDEEKMREAHIMRPSTARQLAAHLNAMADRADSMMPPLK